MKEAVWSLRCQARADPDARTKDEVTPLVMGIAARPLADLREPPRWKGTSELRLGGRFGGFWWRNRRERPFFHRFSRPERAVEVQILCRYRADTGLRCPQGSPIELARERKDAEIMKSLGFQGVWHGFGMVLGLFGSVSVHVSLVSYGLGLISGQICHFARVACAFHVNR